MNERNTINKTPQAKTDQSIMETIRTFLKNNKIFFETVVMVTLTVAGVIISINSNTIMKKQVAIEEALAKPVINLKAIYNENRLKEVNIYSQGSSIRNIRIDVMPYYDVTMFKDTEDLFDQINLKMPVGCISEPILDIINYNNNSGLLYSIVCTDTTSSYIQDLKDFQKESNDEIEPDLSLAFISLEYFVRIDYTDVLGNDVSEGYKCIISNHETYTDTDIRMTIPDDRIEPVLEDARYYNVYLEMCNTKLLYMRSDDIDTTERYKFFVSNILNLFSNGFYLE